MEGFAMGDSLILLDKLDQVKSTGNDTWRARCPSHEGRSQSLSIKLVDDRLLINCFAGCSVGEVVESIGLRISDLFDKQLDSDPVARRYRNHANAREILESILVPIRTVLLAVAIQDNRTLSSDELKTFQQARATINQALDAAVNQGVIYVD
jgi:hypothetical protein